MGSATSHSDSGFGPLLAGKGDFTLLFEESIFTTAPSAIAVFAACLQIYAIVGEPKLVRSGALLWVKLTWGLVLAASHIATLALWTTMTAEQTRMTLPSASSAVVGSVAILLFLVAEHFYSYRLSTFLSLFMSLTLLLDIARTYSCFNRLGLSPLSAMYILSCVARFLFLISQEVSKRRLIRLESLRTSVSRESVSGFWTRSLFLWVNSTLLLGFRQVLRVEDLPPIAPEFRAKTVYDAFKPQWDRVNKQSKYALVKACLLAQAVPFITITIPRLCLIGFTFAQPFLMLRTTTAVGQDELPDDTPGGLVGATILIYFGIAVTKGYSTHLAYQVTTCIRGMLVVAIYDKMLHLSYDSLANSAAVTLMSTDLSGLERLVPLFHDMWAAVVELAFGMAILGSIVGPSCILLLIPGVVTTVGSSIITKKMTVARTAWNEKIEERVAKTSNIVAQLKVIKMAGLSQPLLGLLDRLREAEIKTSMRERQLRVAIGSLNAFSRAIPPVLVIAGALFWTRIGDGITSGQVYTVLAVVSIVSQPLHTLLLALPSLSGALASFPRVQQFLCLEEQTDNRSINDNGNSIRVANLTVNSDISRAIMQDVNLQIEAGTIAMLAGPVGCGKTVLLKVMIGEIEFQVGSIDAPSCPMGYSDQAAWLENISIRDNICHEDFNAVRYQEVITACALGPDLAALPFGDNTVVGTNGTNLSGGQRQRVALARAAYCQAPVVVLDDPLSAVDSKTATAIMERLFGENGILRLRNTTVIMTTSSRDNCSVADCVFQMNSEGKVQRLPGLAKDSNRRRSPRELVSAQQDEKAGPSTTITEPPVRITPPQATEDEVDHEVQKGDYTLYTYYMGSAKRHLLILSFLFVALSSLSDKLPAIYIRIWQDKDPYDDTYFIGYAGFGLLKVLASTVSLTLYFRNIVAGTSIELHRRLLTVAMNASLPFLSATDAGSILNRFSEDMTLIAQGLPIYFMNSFYATVTVVMEIAIICAGARYIAAIIPVLLLVLYLVLYFYLRTSRQLRVREIEARAPLFTKFTETADGIQHIRAFKWQESFSLQTQEHLDHSQAPYYTLFCVQRWLTMVLDLTVCAVAAMLVSLAVSYRGLTTENSVGLAMLNVVMFSDSLTHLVESIVDLETSLGGVARVRRFCLGTPQESDDQDETSNHATLPDHWPSTGAIEFRGVSASYRQLNGRSHQVLNNISFSIGDGKKLGLSGRTGSGKSTIIAVLLGMIDYTGSILIDGRELRTVPTEFLRSRIITLTQDGVQLQGTIRLNLDPYDPPDYDSGTRLADQTLITALTRVGLWETVQSCGGLDADMQASNFSEGQHQLLGIARAMLRKSYTLSKIVIFDEATSSIDNDTDRKIQALIADVFANCTVLMTSHRLYAFDKMHKVIMLNDGYIEDTLKRDPTSGLLVEA